MAAPIRLTRKTIQEAPYEVWNAMVHIAFLPYEELDETQRVPHHALWYESEVNNGGHLQYFENHRAARLEEVLSALRRIGAECQAEVLARAAAQWLSKTRPAISTAEQYVQIALQGEFDQFDQAFYRCAPTITALLEQYLQEHESAFVEWVD